MAAALGHGLPAAVCSTGFDTCALTSRPQARDPLPLALAHYPEFFSFIVVSP